MRSTACFWSVVLCLGCATPPISAPATAGTDGGSGSGGAPGDAWFLPPIADAADVAAPEVAPGCRRSVNLRGVSVTHPVPFDVVIVADNSDSLSWSRDSLSAGLENLLSRVRGHEIRFFVLTSTQYGASSEAAVSPFTGKELVSWRDSVSKAPYANPVTEYKRSCVGDKGTPITCPPKPAGTAYTLKGEWQFRMPAAVAAITPAMTDVELTAQQKKIADAVLALGGGGAQQEQPICTLNRYVAQKPELLPKHVVFVVLTDEDDTSPPEACLAAHEARYSIDRTGTSEQCFANCAEYHYSTSRANEEERLTFKCLPVDDKGVEHPERVVEKSLVVTIIARCGGVTTRDCSAAELAKASAACGGGHVVKGCKLGCGTSQGYVSCGLTRTDDRVDLCKQPFDEAGTRYQDLLDYCTRTSGPGWGPCGVLGTNPGMGSSVSMGFVEFSTPLVSGSSTADLSMAFKQSADNRFGRGNYSVEAIVLDPAFNCPLHPGQSYAPNLRQLATSPRDVFPLCQDYAPALERIESFGATLIRTEYPLDLDEYEAVDSVVVTTRSGGQRTLRATDYKYDRAAKILRFNPGALGAQDESLSVNVARYCERIVE